jgi:hypothetical protein
MRGALLRGIMILAACVALVGCGGGNKGAKIDGKLTKNGQAWKPEEGQTLSLSLASASDVYPASVNAADGTFVIPIAGGKLVPPGKYQVKASLSSSSAGNDAASLAKLSTLNKQVEGLGKAEVEVTDAPTQVITVDIATGSVTRQ